MPSREEVVDEYHQQGFAVVDDAVDPAMMVEETIEMPVQVILGVRDRTALGKDLVAEDVAARLGDYPALSRAAVAAMPDGRRVLFDGVGHLPFIEAPARFRRALADTLGIDTPAARSQPITDTNRPEKAHE